MQLKKVYARESTGDEGRYSAFLHVNLHQRIPPPCFAPFQNKGGGILTRNSSDSETKSQRYPNARIPSTGGMSMRGLQWVIIF